MSAESETPSPLKLMRSATTVRLEVELSGVAAGYLQIDADSEGEDLRTHTARVLELYALQMHVDRLRNSFSNIDLDLRIPYTK